MGNNRYMTFAIRLNDSERLMLQRIAEQEQRLSLGETLRELLRREYQRRFPTPTKQQTVVQQEQ